MCLQIPRRVIGVNKDSVIVEGNKKLIFKGNMAIKPGDYVLPYGNIVVSVISRESAHKMNSALSDHSV